jgi:hypothetical protein
MRTISLAVALATALALPAFADETPGQMVTLKADQIGQIFCLSRIGNDEAVIEGILTEDLTKAIAAAEEKDAAFSKKYPGEKPPLGDGIPWQSAPDYAAKCQTGLITLSKSDAKVELKYGFPDEPAADFTDTLILKKIPIEGMDVGYWRIDNIIYSDGTDLKGTLVSAFDGVE